MPPLKCCRCDDRGFIKTSKTGDVLCKKCFCWVFEEEIHWTITSAQLFKPGECVAIGASGGKDSTVLAYVLKTLNERHNYGLNLILLSVDEGISGYRDDSLESVKRNQVEYNLPLKIVSYKELYGWTMDEIVKQIGRKNNCTFCGVFRRQALDRGALMLKVDKIVTGHNADDIAETVLMNILRGDIARLSRCFAIATGSEGMLPRCKPFKYTYEKEIVMYARVNRLDYFTTECIYSPDAYRGYARAYIKDLERIRPRAILDIIHSAEQLAIHADVKMPVQRLCSRCQYISSHELCKACLLLEGLNTGQPQLGVGKSRKPTNPVSGGAGDNGMAPSVPVTRRKREVIRMELEQSSDTVAQSSGQHCGASKSSFCMCKAAAALQDGETMNRTTLDSADMQAIERVAEALLDSNTIL